MKIGSRLTLGFGLSILITIIIGLFALSEMKVLGDLTDKMYRHPLTVSNAVRDIRTNIIAMHRSMKDVALAENIEQIDEAAEIVNQYEQQVYYDFDIVFDRFLGDLSEVEHAKQVFSEWKIIRDDVIRLSRQDKRIEAADITRGRGARHVTYMMKEIDGLIDFAAAKSDKFLFDTEQKIKKTRTIMAVLLSIIVFLGIISSILITRSIVIPLGIIVRKIRNLSHGNLSGDVNIYRNDEVGILADSFRELKEDIAQRARILEQISSGDFSADKPPRSEKDDIGKSFFAMTSSLRKATAALDRSEQKFSNLMVSVPIGISVSTLEGKVLEVNQAAIEMFGFTSKKKFANYPTIEYYHNPDDRNRFIEAQKKGIVKDFELRFKRRDGSLFWGSVTSTTQTSEIYGTLFINSFMDITERKKSEEALIKEGSFVSLLKSIAVTANEASTIEEAMQVCLDKVCTLMDWPVGHVYLPLDDDSRIMRPTRLWHMDDPEKLTDFCEVTLKSTFKSGIGLPGRILADKQPLWIVDVTNDPGFLRAKLVENLGVKAAFGFPVLLETQVVAVLEFFSKTEAEPDKKLLDVMANIGKQLGRVVERTRAREILKKSLIEAESANMAKSNFLTSMSHELRTPLNAILGFSQILEGEFEGKLNRTQKNYVSDILGSGKHLLSLINDILDLSKIEEGKSDLKLETLDIKALLSNSLIMIRKSCIDHNITLELDSDASLENIQVTADSKKIKQIMYNLLSNAVKFTPDNGSILVKASRSSDSLEVSITDSGIGIEDEDQKKIFQKFFQTEGGIVNKTKGTGLGLNIVKNLVELHGGKIIVKSEGKNKGTTFNFTIPLGEKT